MKKKILNSLFYCLIATYLTIWITDYVRVKMDMDPMFYITSSDVKYTDGFVTTFKSIGYKVIKYNRKSLTKGYEYGFLSLEEK